MINISKEFFKLYNSEPLIARSAGRINIIGEHTDYNMGYVLPTAIDKYTYVSLAKNQSNSINIYAANLNESFTTTLDQIQPTNIDWANYVLGVVNQIQLNGQQICGIDVLIYGEIPIGAGLSSSAALSCATIFGINELFDLEIDKLTMVKMAQRTEHSHAGVKCGIMDMFASMFSRSNSVIKLDCMSMDYEYIPLNLEGYKILLLNTNVSHALASSEYNTRRQECDQGVAWVRAHHPEVTSLRDVSLYQLNKYVLLQSETIYKRCKYVVDENLRLLKACENLQDNNIVALGKKMFKTHEGLSHDFEVSCKELDFLVNAVKANPNVLGSRMMGGGFGGCTINIVKEDAVNETVEILTNQYKQYFHLDLTPHIVITGTGTEIVKNEELCLI